MTDARRELTVSLAREGGKLARAYYFGDYGKIHEAEPVEWSLLGSDFAFGESTGLDAMALLLDRGREDELVEHFSQDKLGKAGELLFMTLFGAEDNWKPVLRTTFDQRDGAAPHPIRYPVRLRILTTDPVLLGLPWRATAWNGRRLVQDRWTFEVTLDDKPDKDPRLPGLCRLLVIAPIVAGLRDLRTDAHLHQLGEALARISPEYTKEACFRVTRTHEEVRRELANMQPDVVYYYGHGEVVGGLACLVLEGGPPISMADLKQSMRPYPQLVYVNGCMTGASGWQSAGHQLAPEVPVVVSNRTTAWDEHMGPAAIAWLSACLGGELPKEPGSLDPVPREPVVLLDRLAGVESTRGFQWTTTVVHTGYRRWIAAEVRHRPQRVGIGLDRWPQRNTAFSQITRLVQKPEKRVEAIVAYGAPGNMIEHAADQLIDFLETIGAQIARIKRLELEFPPARGVDGLKRGLAAQLRAKLGIGEYDGLEGALRNSAAMRDASPAIPVLWLDWGTFAAGEQAPLSLDPDQLAPWIELCSVDLAPACPPEIRIVSFLAMELDADQHKKLARRFEQHQEDFGTRAFDADLLPAFDRVTRKDLGDYMRDDLGVPEALAKEIAGLVIAKTKGRYDETVALLEEGLATTWGALRAKLRGRP